MISLCNSTDCPRTGPGFTEICLSLPPESGIKGVRHHCLVQGNSYKRKLLTGGLRIVSQAWFMSGSMEAYRTGTGAVYETFTLMQAGRERLGVAWVFHPQ